MLTAACRGFRVFSMSSSSVSRLCASVMEGAICRPHHVSDLNQTFKALAEESLGETLT